MSISVSAPESMEKWPEEEGSQELGKGGGGVTNRLENIYLLCERLASLGVMGAQLRAPFKPLNTIML